jgi:hypothetical protein
MSTPVSPPSAPQFPPTNYEDLIEGQPLSGGGAYPGFDATQHLQPGWENAFCQHRYFRLVGFAHLLAAHGIAFGSLRQADTFKPKIAELLPPTWINSYFPADEWAEFRGAQIVDAYQGRLQRFDKAALSIIYLQAVFAHFGISASPYRIVRIRPVTWFIEGGFDTVIDLIKANAKGLHELAVSAGQSHADFISDMASGQKFAARKSADHVL